MGEFLIFFPLLCLKTHYRGVKPTPKKRCPAYSTKMYQVVRFQFWRSKEGVWSFFCYFYKSTDPEK